MSFTRHTDHPPGPSGSCRRCCRSALLRSLGFPVVLAALLLLTGGSSRSEGEAEAGLTAYECVEQADRHFGKREYGEASSLYQRFIDDFGKSPEAAEAIRAIRFRHAMSFVHLKKFSEGIPALKAALDQRPPLSTAEVQELQFWLGVAELEEKNYAAAREALGSFLKLFPAGAERTPSYVTQYPAAMKISEAALLVGSAWLLEEQYSAAAGHFEKLGPDLVPENRSRAVVLRLYALLQGRQNEEAMALVDAEFPRLAELTQLASFQCLTLELGSRWLEAGELRRAISCLQRVWPAARILKHQQTRLDDLESRLKAAEADPRADPYRKFLLAQLAQKVRRELEHFRSIPDFDTALRLRLASAYREMGRHLEAGLILEELLAQLPASTLGEQAAVSLVQTWFEIERWPKVLEAAEQFQNVYLESASGPLVLYLVGLAGQKSGHFDAAAIAFDAVSSRHAVSEFTPRAHFMRGFTCLLEEKNPEAIAQFEAFLKKYPKHDLAEAASYWRGMGYSFDGQYEKAREAMGGHLKAYREGSLTGSAVFRRAYCAQQAGDFAVSIKELRAYLRNFPEHEHTSEAKLLLGDALLNEGEIEDGISVFRDISADDSRFYEEGIFKTAKALKLLEEYDQLLALMSGFAQKFPRSPRVAEAVFQAGWVHRQKNRTEQARELYWEAIKKYGPDPSIRSVDELFPALAKLYPRDDPDAYVSLLSGLLRRANSSGDRVLAMRALWAQGIFLRKSDPARSRELLVQAHAMSCVQTTNPLLLADFAGALAAAGDQAAASDLYRELLRWNPRAPQKDRALAELGLAAARSGDAGLARKYFERFRREVTGSRETGRVLMASATLEEDSGHRASARKLLEDLLSAESSTGLEKAEALYRIGQSHMAEGNPRLAIPYYQRIYVMHGRWREWVAKAYLRSGEAFEKIRDTGSARRTYEEITAKDELADLPESAAARRRLHALQAAGAAPSNPDNG